MIFFFFALIYYRNHLKINKHLSKNKVLFTFLIHDLQRSYLFPQILESWMQFQFLNILYSSLQQHMSKSVRSYGSSSARGKSSQQQAVLIKQKIKQILYSVKEQRQHIENRLYQNDIEINKLRKQYQMLRYQHDFQHLNAEQQIFVQQLSEGLKQSGINPQLIMGIPDSSNDKYRSMTKQQIIDVQGLLIKQLANLLKQ